MGLTQTSPLVVVAVSVCRQRGASFAVAVFARIRCECGDSPDVALALHIRRQGVAPRRERVQVDDVLVPGTSEVEVQPKTKFMGHEILSFHAPVVSSFFVLFKTLVSS